MRPQVLKSVAIVVVSCVVVGCAVGPDYQPPKFALEAEWQRQVSAHATEDAAWWQASGQEQLATWITQALANNRDLKQARSRVAEAEAGLIATRGTRLPAINAEARYTYFEQSLESPATASALIDAGLIPRDGEFYNAGLQASWELDLLGLRRRQVEAALARTEAAGAEAQALRLRIIAQTVSAAADWSGNARRVEVAERNAALQRRTLAIISGKVRLGLSRRLDEVRAQSTLAQLESRIPLLRAAAVESRQQLAVLLGVDATLLPEQAPALQIPADWQPAVGSKAALLRRRPDIVLAERLLAAASADYAASVAAMFPQLTLTANGGFEAGDLANLASGDARAIGIVPFVRWPLFQGRRLRAAKAQADARRRQALAGYEQAVLVAFADAESALAAQRAANGALASLKTAAAAAREAEALAGKLYQQGLSDYLTLLDAQRQLAAVEDALIVAENRVMLVAARLYKSLGGDWQAGQ